jgi:lipopolysaccharide export system protein LptA
VKRSNDARRAAALAAAMLALAACPVLAEKADKEKPTNIEANKMSSDDSKRMSIFEGNVLLTKGTVVVRADRIVVRQDADGFQFATAYGNPVRFRQRGDAKAGCEGVWTDGEALRVEVDDRNEQVHLYERARITRDKDVVNGEYIFLDQRTEFFSVQAAKGAAPTAPEGKVTVVLQPKGAAADAGKSAPASAASRCPPAARATK